MDKQPAHTKRRGRGAHAKPKGSARSKRQSKHASINTHQAVASEEVAAGSHAAAVEQTPVKPSAIPNTNDQNTGPLVLPEIDVPPQQPTFTDGHIRSDAALPPVPNLPNRDFTANAMATPGSAQNANIVPSTWGTTGQQPANGRYSGRKPKPKRGRTVALVVVLLIAVGVFGGGAFAFLHSDTGRAIVSSTPFMSLAGDGSSASNASNAKTESAATPIIAQSAGVDLHCAVPVKSLTEILIHNASYGYACPITTQLQEATNADVLAAHGTGRDLNNQPTGNNWMTGQFIRCFRSGYAGPTMSAIDCGAAAGTTVLSPVSGTVVKVKQYDLYDNPDHPDIQIHIQPEGRPDLDVVLIHCDNVTAQEGQKVEAGTTPIATLRDIYAYLGADIQLADYTAEGDHGNHTHIAVNDVNNPDYHGLDDE